MVLIKVNLNHKKYIYIHIYTHIHTCIYLCICIYICMRTYTYPYKQKYNISNVNHKNDNSNSNGRKWSYCLKEILLAVCTLYIFCMDIKRVPNSLFLIWRSNGYLIVSIQLVLNPIFLGLKTITIQYRDKQSALYVFQKYRFCEDYTNLFWAQMFLLGFLKTNLGEFQTFPLPKLATFCDVFKQTCLYLAVYEMLMHYLDMLF